MAENSENTLSGNSEYSFRAAYDSLPKNKLREARKKIGRIFNVRTDKSVYERINGVYEPKVGQAKAINHLFKTFGVKVTWGAKTNKQ